MTTQRWARAALVPVRRGERRAETMALPAGLPTVDELFTFMRDAERRFETLRLRIEERAYGARAIAPAKNGLQIAANGSLPDAVRYYSARCVPRLSLGTP
jgi:hypothetical protein